jgi:hypothetical protein
VLGRTGFQTYQLSEVPADMLADVGIDAGNGRGSVEFYRAPEDVFDPRFLASLEGKPITDQHPDGFVDPQNFKKHSCGHVQDVRAGKDPLEESGEYPILGDLHIQAEPLLSKVRNKESRQLSIGYDYGLRRDENKLCQCDMVGNHIAVVPRGRAGPEARIADAEPEPVTDAAAVATATTATTEERKPVSNILKHILGLGLKQLAATETDPEKLADAMDAVQGSVRARAADGRRRAAGRDEEEPTGHEVEEFRADDRHADDRHADDRHADDRRTDDRHHADDARATDRRKRMHDALDRALDGGEAETCPTCGADRRAAADVDMDELKGLLGDFFTEEQGEAEHAVEDEGAEMEVSEPSGVEEVEEETLGADRRAAAADSAGTTLAALNRLRRQVARTGDSRLIGAFNRELRAVRRGSRTTDGDRGYGAFSSTARQRTGAPARPVVARAADSNGKTADQKLQDGYNAAFKEANNKTGGAR